MTVFQVNGSRGKVVTKRYEFRGGEVFVKYKKRKIVESPAVTE